MLPPRARHAARINHLLAGLDPEDSALLKSVVRIESPPPHRVLGSRTHPASDIWFPHSGVIALSVTDNKGRMVQTGLVGVEGCVGLETIFDQSPAIADSWVQIAGEMSVVSTTSLRSVLEARPSIHAALARFLYQLSAQSLQTIACNRLHSLEARCCRWLLMMRDRTYSNDLPLTQENLATMLGSGRPRINGLLGRLEREGLVHRYRGRIRLLSRTGLERQACECYRQLSHR